MIRAKCQEYTIIFDVNSRLYAQRHGEDWREMPGDGMVLAMLQKIDDLEKSIKAAKDILMTSLIATPESQAEICTAAFTTLGGTK